LTAARRSGSIQTRIAIGRPPSLVADALHAGTVASCGWTLRVSQSVRLGQAALGRREAQVERRVRTVGALHVDGRRLGLGRQFTAHLLQARRDFGERRVVS
jgi:hypothetical protein